MKNCLRLIRRTVQVSIIMGLCAQSVMALPPKHEANRLLLAAESALAANQWEVALNHLKQMEALEITLPDNFHFYYGKVLVHEGDYAKAIEHLEKFVVSAGEESENYQPALMLITQAKQALDKESQKQPRSSITYGTQTTGDTPFEGRQYSTGGAANEPVSGDEYLRSLRKLYLVSNDQQALLMHVNALLADHPYYGTRLKKAKRESGVDVQIAIDPDKSLVIQEKHYSAGGRIRLNVFKQGVYGLDPIIRYGCNMDELVCWLYHPVHPNERWIVLDRNEEAAAELALAMSRLIRLLQKQ